MNPWEVVQWILSNAGRFIANPITQGATALASTREQNRAIEEYLRDATRQISDSLGIAGQIGPQTLTTYDDSARKQLGGLQSLLGATRQNREDFLSDFRGSGERLQRGYQDRYNRAAQDLEGYGQQGYADIDRGAEEERGRFALNPLSRGSTIGTSVNQSIEDARQANRRRFGEDLTRMRTGILSQLSGDTLASQGGLNASRAAYDASMRGDTLGAMGNLANFWGQNAANRSGIVNQGLGSYLNTLAGINLTPPAPNPIPFMAGQNSVQIPSPPSWWEQNFGNLAGAGIGAAGNLGGAAILASALSDRNLKTDFKPIDEADILRRLETLPIEKWRYIDGGPEHVGTMAQNFHETFGMGDDKMIPIVDAIGVLMASVKALSAEVRELRKQKAA